MTDYRSLGATGLKVSPLTLGTMMFGSIGNPDHDDSIRIIHRALDSGINLVDTADVYSQGESETIVGKALKGRRDDVVLATKVHGRLGEDVNQAGNSRRWIIRAVEDSLRRLQTDWIDLYQVHRPEPDTDIDETLGALSDLVRQGKIRYIGTSTFEPGQIVEAQYVARERHRERPVTEQPPVLHPGARRGTRSPAPGPAPQAGCAAVEPARRGLAVRPDQARRRPHPVQPGRPAAGAA